MKKILILILFVFLNTHAYADRLVKNGFLNNEMGYEMDQNINDPKNKIILILNHGQGKHDKKSKDCYYSNNISNFSLLVGIKINEKELMVYNLCTENLVGDDWRNLWIGENKRKKPYKGKTKLEKRLDKNLELIEMIISIGVPKNQIIMAGNSCGGWLTMMLISKYPNKIGGGISMNQACYGDLSRTKNVKKHGVKKALIRFSKIDPGPSKMRKKQINEIKKSKNLPVLVFTHPKDPYDGLLSDWVEEIPGITRVIISNDRTINGKKCFRKGLKKNGKEWKKKLKNPHYIWEADCFQYYNPTILDYISSRVSS